VKEQVRAVLTRMHRTLKHRSMNHPSTAQHNGANGAWSYQSESDGQGGMYASTVQRLTRLD